jgi:signal transduction histidine kinase
VQEAVNNIIKHAHASHVLLQVVELEDSVTIYIEDNGKGIDSKLGQEGNSLKMLKSNVAYLNGTIEINGNENKGTFILAELPIEIKHKNNKSI